MRLQLVRALRVAGFVAPGGLVVACGPGPGSSDPSGGSSSGGVGSTEGAASASSGVQEDGPGGTSSSGSLDEDSADSSSSDGSRPEPRCEAILQAGIDGGVSTGFEICDGAVHRVAPATCGAPMPGGDACDPEAGGTCTVDADCAERPFGRCVSGLQSAACGCRYGCETDADCPDGRLCACGGEGFPEAYPMATECVAATCTSADDCNGERCALGYSAPCGPWFIAACTTPQDTCTASATCRGPLVGRNYCWPYDPLGKPPEEAGSWDCHLFGVC